MRLGHYKISLKFLHQTIMKLNFDTAIQEVAKKFMAQVKEISPNCYSLDVPFELQDGTKRYQYVYAWVIAERAKGKDCYYFSSRCGIINKTTDYYNLLKEASYGIYTSITIAADQTASGEPCEAVVIQASPIAEYVTTVEEMAVILWEVAEMADIIEEKYFGGDKN